jgi:hypothetical protein
MSKNKLARENLSKAIGILPEEEYFREELKKLDEKKNNPFPRFPTMRGRYKPQRREK